MQKIVKIPVSHLFNETLHSDFSVRFNYIILVFNNIACIVVGFKGLIKITFYKQTTLLHPRSTLHVFQLLLQQCKFSVDRYYRLCFPVRHNRSQKCLPYEYSEQDVGDGFSFSMDEFEQLSWFAHDIRDLNSEVPMCQLKKNLE